MKRHHLYLVQSFMISSLAEVGPFLLQEYSQKCNRTSYTSVQYSGT